MVWGREGKAGECGLASEQAREEAAALVRFGFSDLRCGVLTSAPLGRGN